MTRSIGYNDGIRILIHDLDAFTFTCNIYIKIVEKFKVDAVPTNLKCINNGIEFLFKDLRYELKDILVDSRIKEKLLKIRNVDLVSIMKNCLCINRNGSICLENAEWCKNTEEKGADNIVTCKSILIEAKCNFNVCIPFENTVRFFWRLPKNNC